LHNSEVIGSLRLLLLKKVVSLFSHYSFDVLSEHRVGVRDGVGEPDLVIIIVKGKAKAEGVVALPLPISEPLLFWGHTGSPIPYVVTTSLPTHELGLVPLL
jgi:hypothetical protein